MVSGSSTISSESDPLARRFAAWRGLGRRALIPYITAGYPEPGMTVKILHAMADAGADVIELGVPFSDPVADGPTIQRSSQRALEHGVTIDDVLRMLATFRRSSAVPVVLFSYLNPIVAYGVERFIADAVAAGAEGILITDLPVGADPAMERQFHESPLSFIRLVAPTTRPDRLDAIAAAAQGFVYYVGNMGVTGARATLRAETLREVAALRQRFDIAFAVGFGVSTPEHAREIAGVAEGVIVGSALIDALDSGGVAAMAALLRDMREAIGR
jgi:tryptophan synthase alpha chain